MKLKSLTVACCCNPKSNEKWNNWTATSIQQTQKNNNKIINGVAVIKIDSVKQKSTTKISFYYLFFVALALAKLRYEVYSNICIYWTINLTIKISLFTKLLYRRMYLTKEEEKKSLDRLIIWIFYLCIYDQKNIQWNFLVTCRTGGKWQKKPLVDVYNFTIICVDITLWLSASDHVVFILLLKVKWTAIYD